MSCCVTPAAEVKIILFSDTAGDVDDPGQTGFPNLGLLDQSMSKYQEVGFTPMTKVTKLIVVF